MRMNPASFVVVAAVLSTTACPDFVPNEKARITCKSNDECPSTWTCEAVVGRCIPQLRSDNVAPDVTDVTIDPAAGTTGTVVNINFTADSALDHNPAVAVGGA